MVLEVIRELEKFAGMYHKKSLIEIFTINTGYGDFYCKSW